MFGAAPPEGKLALRSVHPCFGGEGASCFSGELWNFSFRRRHFLPGRKFNRRCSLFLESVIVQRSVVVRSLPFGKSSLMLCFSGELWNFYFRRRHFLPGRNFDRRCSLFLESVIVQRSVVVRSLLCGNSSLFRGRGDLAICHPPIFLYLMKFSRKIRDFWNSLKNNSRFGAISMGFSCFARI